MEITGANGQVHDFDPTDITMLSADSGESFLVFGLAGYNIRVMSELTEFMSGLPNKDKFVQLTFARNGHDFWANVERIASVADVDPTNLVAFPLANARMTFNKGHGNRPFFITQGMADATARINAAGGSLS